MAKVAARLFRDTGSAQKAVGELLAKGYKSEEIGLLLKLKDGRRLLSLLGKDSASVTLTKVGELNATGPLARGLAQAGDNASKELARLLEANQETYNYYEFGLSMGGVLVTVHCEETRLGQAQRLLRLASAETLPIGKPTPNPGFTTASRMAATDSLDAKMTGDFRRY